MVDSKKHILIKNIYYMLSYAFQVLKQTNFEEVASEEFENIQDLLAAILAKGVAQQLKQGLYREYVQNYENLPMLRGKLDLTGTMRNKQQNKRLLACDFDDLSENNIFNIILKTTATVLLSDMFVSSQQRTALKNVTSFFKGIDECDPCTIHWNQLCFHRNNQNYMMLLNICYFVLNGLLLTTEHGKYKLASFLDERHMSTLYEKFVLEYYRYHRPDLSANPSEVKWALEAGNADLLPKMRTDITLEKNGNFLIIDTKYYSHILQSQERFDSSSLHSSNMYQIMAYVQNKDADNTGSVAGVLLYAKTDERIALDKKFQIKGNKYFVKMLDLNTDFEKIKEQLNVIVEEYFGVRSD